MPAQASPPRAALDGMKPSATLALRREAAAQALGISEETFDKHVRPSLPVVRLGSVRIYSITALERWLLEHADSPINELERR